MSQQQTTKPCEWCGKDIPWEHYRKRPREARFCDRDCYTAWGKASGEFAKKGRLGVEAQAAYKEEHGHVPKYAKRAAAVIVSNREHPRRKRKGKG